MHEHYLESFVNILLFISIVVSQDHPGMVIFTFDMVDQPIHDMRPVHMGLAFLYCMHFCSQVMIGDSTHLNPMQYCDNHFAPIE